MITKMPGVTGPSTPEASSGPLSRQLPLQPPRVPQHGILVVNSDPKILELLQQQLGQTCNVYATTSVEAALETLEREPVALVIAGQDTHDIGGTELLARVMEKRPDAIRILLTGGTDTPELAAAMNRGQVYHYLTRPWDSEELKTVVCQGFERYELEKLNQNLLHDLKAKNFELYFVVEELKRVQQELLQSERHSSVGKMVNMVVHDLKDPLTSIMGLAKLLLDMPMLDESKRLNYYRMIQGESQRILQMILEVLEYVRGETTDLQLEPCSLSDYLEELRGELEENLKDRSVALEIEAYSPGRVLLDRCKFRRALTSMVINAREYMPAGGLVRLILDEDKEWVRLRISDTGCGIPERLQPHIFQPFFAKGEEKGPGVGLSTVRRIVEAHQGEIELESSSPSGTTFCVCLPRREKP